VRSERPERERCPDDERLAAFAEGSLSASEREALEMHLADCPSCLDVAAALLAPDAATHMPVEDTKAPGSAPRPLRRRGGFRRWAIAAALVLTSGAVLVAALSPRLAPRVARLGSTLLGVPIVVETIAVTRGKGASAFQISLGKVTVGEEARRHIRIDELAMTMALAAPLRGEPVLSAVRAVRPVVTLPRGAAEPPSWSDGARALSVLQRLGRVELVDARIEMPVRGGVVAITSIDGEIRDTADGRAVALVGRVGDGELAISGTIGSGGDLALTIGGRDLDASALPLLAGRVTGRATLRLDVHGDADHPEVHGRVALHDGRLIGVRPLWTMPLSDELRAALGAVRPALAGEDFPFDELRASYAWRNGRWRLPQVFVREDDLLAGGRAQVERDGGVRGRGTVRIPEDVVTAVESLVPALGEARDPAGTATVPFGLTGRVGAPRLDLDRR
jgi:hypothetical protein